MPGEWCGGWHVFHVAFCQDLPETSAETFPSSSWPSGTNFLPHTTTEGWRKGQQTSPTPSPHFHLPYICAGPKRDGSGDLWTVLCRGWSSEGMGLGGISQHRWFGAAEPHRAAQVAVIAVGDPAVLPQGQIAGTDPEVWQCLSARGVLTLFYTTQRL